MASYLGLLLANSFFFRQILLKLHLKVRQLGFILVIVVLSRSYVGPTLQNRIYDILISMHIVQENKFCLVLLQSHMLPVPDS